MTIIKTAEIKINEKEATILLNSLLSYIDKLIICQLNEDETVEERAREILDLYYMAYNISKIPEFSAIKVPSLEEIKNNILNH